MVGKILYVMLVGVMSFTLLVGCSESELDKVKDMSEEANKQSQQENENKNESNDNQEDNILINHNDIIKDDFLISVEKENFIVSLDEVIIEDNNENEKTITSKLSVFNQSDKDMEVEVSYDWNDTTKRGLIDANSNDSIYISTIVSKDIDIELIDVSIDKIVDDERESIHTFGIYSELVDKFNS